MIAIGALVAIVVVATWAGCIGFGRARTAYARLHYVTFVALGTGLPTIIVALAADGLSSRTLKIVLLELVLVVSGAAVTHATGRAIALRQMTEEDT